MALSIAGRTRERAVVALACSAQFVDVLGVTVLIVALPAIAHDLHLGEEALSWTAAAYPLVFGGFLVAGGRAADLFGRRATFVAGSALVAAGSLLCAVAGTGWLLVTGRALQGFGAAVSVPAALAAVLATLPEGARRSRALGWWTMAGAVGGASGFVLGGLVTQLAGWRWLFAAIGPVALAAAVLAATVLASVISGHEVSGRGASRPASSGSAVTPPRRLDAAGALLSTAAVVLVLLGLNRAEAAGFTAPSAWLPLLLGPVAAVAFLVVERRVADPLVPPRVWTVPTFRLGAAVAVVLTATTSGANVVGTLALQSRLHLSAGAAGASFLLFSLGVVVSSLAVPWLLRRTSRPAVMALGLAVIAASMGAEALGVALAAVPLFLTGLALSGVGLGAASVASTAHGTADADESTAGLVGGLLNAAAQLGTAVGIAVLLVAVAGPAHGYVRAYLVGGAVAIVAAGVTALHRRGTRTVRGPADRHGFTAIS